MSNDYQIINSQPLALNVFGNPCAYNIQLFFKYVNGFYVKVVKNSDFDQFDICVFLHIDNKCSYFCTLKRKNFREIYAIYQKVVDKSDGLWYNLNTAPTGILINFPTIFLPIHILFTVIAKEIIMGPYYYTVLRIDGDYAFLKRTDISDNDELQVALALLPDGTDEGSSLVWKDLEYSFC